MTDEQKDKRIAELERASFNSGYCYGLEGDASPEELDCAWDLHCRDRRAALLAMIGGQTNEDQ